MFDVYENNKTLMSSPAPTQERPNMSSCAIRTNEILDNANDLLMRILSSVNGKPCDRANVNTPSATCLSEMMENNRTLATTLLKNLNALAEEVGL